MGIQIACHKYITDKLTNKLLTTCIFIHFDFLMTNYAILLSVYVLIGFLIR